MREICAGFRCEMCARRSQSGTWLNVAGAGLLHLCHPCAHRERRWYQDQERQMAHAQAGGRPRPRPAIRSPERSSSFDASYAPGS
jgi:ribosome-binding protein aMBF1 (putative translation factor)